MATAIHSKFLKLLKSKAVVRRCSAATLLKRRLGNRCFPMNFAEILRTPIVLQNATGGYFCSS